MAFAASSAAEREDIPSSVYFQYSQSRQQQQKLPFQPLKHHEESTPLQMLQRSTSPSIQLLHQQQQQQHTSPNQFISPNLQSISMQSSPKLTEISTIGPIHSDSSTLSYTQKKLEQFGGNAATATAIQPPSIVSQFPVISASQSGEGTTNFYSYRSVDQNNYSHRQATNLSGSSAQTQQRIFQSKQSSLNNSVPASRLEHSQNNLIKSDAAYQAKNPPLLLESFATSNQISLRQHLSKITGLEINNNINYSSNSSRLINEIAHNGSTSNNNNNKNTNYLSQQQLQKFQNNQPIYSASSPKNFSSLSLQRKDSDITQKAATTSSVVSPSSSGVMQFDKSSSISLLARIKSEDDESFKREISQADSHLERVLKTQNRSNKTLETSPGIEFSKSDNLYLHLQQQQNQQNTQNTQSEESPNLTTFARVIPYEKKPTNQQQKRHEISSKRTGAKHYQSTANSSSKNETQSNRHLNQTYSHDPEQHRFWSHLDNNNNNNNINNNRVPQTNATGQFNKHSQNNSNSVLYLQQHYPNNHGLLTNNYLGGESSSWLSLPPSQLQQQQQQQQQFSSTRQVPERTLNESRAYLSAMRALQDRIKELEQQLQLEKENNSQKPSDTNPTIEGNKRIIEEQTEQLKAAQIEIEELTNELESQRQLLETYESNRELDSQTWTRETNDRDLIIAQQSQTINRLQAALTEERATSSESSSKLETLSNQITQLTSEKSTLEARLAAELEAMQSERKKFSDERNQKNEELQRIKYEHERLQERMRTTESRLITKEREFDEYKIHFNAEKVESLRDQLRDQKEQFFFTRIEDQMKSMNNNNNHNHQMLQNPSMRSSPPLTHESKAAAAAVISNSTGTSEFERYLRPNPQAHKNATIGTTTTTTTANLLHSAGTHSTNQINEIDQFIPEEESDLLNFDYDESSLLNSRLNSKSSPQLARQLRQSRNGHSNSRNSAFRQSSESPLRRLVQNPAQGTAGTATATTTSSFRIEPQSTMNVNVNKLVQNQHQMLQHNQHQYQHQHLLETSTQSSCNQEYNSTRLSEHSPGFGRSHHNNLAKEMSFQSSGIQLQNSNNYPNMNQQYHREIQQQGTNANNNHPQNLVQLNTSFGGGILHTFANHSNSNSNLQQMAIDPQSQLRGEQNRLTFSVNQQQQQHVSSQKMQSTSSHSSTNNVFAQSIEQNRNLNYIEEKEVEDYKDATNTEITSVIVKSSSDNSRSSSIPNMNAIQFNSNQQPSQNRTTRIISQQQQHTSDIEEVKQQYPAFSQQDSFEQHQQTHKHLQQQQLQQTSSTSKSKVTAAALTTDQRSVSQHSQYSQNRRNNIAEESNQQNLDIQPQQLTQVFNSSNSSNSNIVHANKSNDIHYSSWVEKSGETAVIEQAVDQNNINAGSELIRDIIEAETELKLLNQRQDHLLSTSKDPENQKNKSEIRKEVITLSEKIRILNEKLYVLKKKEKFIMHQHQYRSLNTSASNNNSSSNVSSTRHSQVNSRI